jgi:cytochrome c oxidase assembly protein subunit 15
MREFDKYRTTDQFKYVHQHFSLREFKYIFFWEWFHRVWARLLGVVFIVGFVYLLSKKKFERTMIAPMVALFLLGALQAVIGWIMVKSGLVPEKYYVGHVELTTHFLAALILLVYTLWFALSLMPAFEQKVLDKGLRNLLLCIGVLLFIQLGYGGFMAGLKAAKTAPTWPDINGSFIPPHLWNEKPVSANLFNNNFMVHFIHRNLAYVLAILSGIFFVKAGRVQHNKLFNRLRYLFGILLLLQIVLGIFTVLNATHSVLFTWLGVSHQFVAMLLVMTLTALFFIVRKR